MVIFISGPMTGYPNYNREAFYAAEKRLTIEGDIVLSPAYLPEGLTDAEYLHICKAYIDVSEGIYLLEGYENSKGSIEELRYAEYKRLKVYKER